MDHSWLDDWKEAIGEYKAKEITEQSSFIGNGMHDLLEKHYTGKELSYKPSTMSRMFAKTIIKKGLSRVSEVWGVEASLYYPDLYAGATDLIGIHDNIPSVMDYKNSRRDKTWEDIETYEQQIVAYADSHNELYGTNISRGVIMMMCHSGRYVEFILEGKRFKTAQTNWWKTLEKYYETFGIMAP
jgi:genome maintenance exonuclease 1